MKVVGEHAFPVPRDELWKALMNPEVLSKVVPGFEKLEETAPNTFDGALMVQVGPVKGRFQGKVELSDLKEPESYALKMTGRGAPGNVQGAGTVQLVAAGGEQTALQYDFDFKIGGKIAGLGQRMLDTTSKAFTQQALENLGRIVEGKVEAEAKGEEAPEIQAPSQAEFAGAVAKEVAEEMFPPGLLAGLGIGLAVGVLIGFGIGFALRHYTG